MYLDASHLTTDLLDRQFLHLAEIGVLMQLRISVYYEVILARDLRLHLSRIFH
jgi:hypothetical protein